MTTTTGRFDLTSWDEEVIDDADGLKRVHARNTKSFEGGITGTSATDLLQGFAAEGTATYVAIERVTAAVDGRKGSFLLRHSALMAGGSGDMLVDVVPNSGTAELIGLAGTMTIAMTGSEHTYTFDYTV